MPQAPQPVERLALVLDPTGAERYEEKQTTALRHLGAKRNSTGMSGDKRQTGGVSSKRGHRYEDYFAVFRLIEYGPQVLDAGAAVRLKEQADSPVDDLVLEGPERTLYHQLKTSPAVTWGADDRKLEREFREQHRRCTATGQPFSLVLVVAEDHRAELLRKQLPAGLEATVFSFPPLKAPSQLAGLRDLLGNAFDSLRASRFPSRTEDEALAGAFFLAFAEHEPDGEGYCVLAQVLETIRSRSLAAVRQQGRLAQARWAEAEAALARIEGLEWWTDRGYFEWRYRQADRGLVGPISSDTFNRFVERVASTNLESFVAFEGLLP